MTANEKFWFPAKRYGWGWGLPSSWQGREVFVTYFVVFIGVNEGGASPDDGQQLPVPAIRCTYMAYHDGAMLLSGGLLFPSKISSHLCTAVLSGSPAI